VRVWTRANKYFRNETKFFGFGPTSAEYKMPTAKGAQNTLWLNVTSTYILYIENQLTFNPSFVFNYYDDGVGDANSNWVLRGSISYRLK
jgi:hypothetical protein